jgi:hypothetical protein
MPSFTDIPAIPLFTCLFSGEGKFEYITWPAVEQNTEVNGWSNDPDRHLDQLSVRVEVEVYVLYCEASLKGLQYPRL